MITNSTLRKILIEYLERNEIALEHIEYLLTFADTLTKKTRYDTIQEVKTAIINDVPLLLLGDDYIQ